MTQVPQSSRKTNNKTSPRRNSSLHGLSKEDELDLLKNTHKFSLARKTRLTSTVNTRRGAGAPMLSFCFLQLCPTPYSYICVWLAVLSQLHQWSSAGGQRLLSRGHTFSMVNPSFYCVVLLTNP